MAYEGNGTVLPIVPMGNNNGDWGGTMGAVLMAALLGNGFNRGFNGVGAADTAAITGLQAQLNGLMDSVNRNETGSQIDSLRTDVNNSTTSIMSGLQSVEHNNLNAVSELGNTMNLSFQQVLMALCNGFAGVNANICQSTNNINSNITQSTNSINSNLCNGFHDQTVQGFKNTAEIKEAICCLSTKMDTFKIADLEAQKVALKDEVSNLKQTSFLQTQFAALQQEIDSLRPRRHGRCNDDEQTQTVTVNNDVGSIINALSGALSAAARNNTNQVK